MTLHSTRLIATDSLFPVYGGGCEEGTTWNLKQFKKLYTTLSCLFGWADKLVDPSTSKFLSNRRKVFSKHSEMLSIPEWFKDASDLGASAGKVKKAQGASEKRAAAAGLFFSSVDITKSSVSVASALNDAQVISLSDISPVLPSTLKGISSVSGLVLRANDLYKQCVRTKKEYAKVPLKNAINHLRQDKETPWKMLSVIGAVTAFATAILSVIAFFFAIKFSPYLALAFMTFTCIASLAADLREAFTPVE